MERKLQSEIIRWLKDHGAYVMKMRAAPGVPVGCPDIIALFQWRWIAIEVKASAKAPFRTGQEATLNHLRKWTSFVFVVYPENWQEVKADLEKRLF